MPEQRVRALGVRRTLPEAPPDDPARDEWQQPDRVLAALELRPGHMVADIGAGTGYFTVRLARAPGVAKVFAVDIEPSMVEYVRQRAAKEGLRNVVVVQGASDRSNLPEPVDLVLIVDTFHHIPNRVAYFRELGYNITYQDPLGGSTSHAISRLPNGNFLAQSDPRKWAALRAHVAALGLPVAGQAREWFGARPTLPDYLPAIGRSRAVPNLFYAFGHQHLGLTLAPVTAEAVAALVAGGLPPVPLAPFDLQRFSGAPA